MGQSSNLDKLLEQIMDSCLEAKEKILKGKLQDASGYVLSAKSGIDQCANELGAIVAGKV